MLWRLMIVVGGVFVGKVCIGVRIGSRLVVVVGVCSTCCPTTHSSASFPRMFKTRFDLDVVWCGVA